jgi:gas vesicle protein
MSKLGDKVKIITEIGVKKLNEGINILGEKTKDAFNMGQFKIKHHQLKQNLNNLFNDLGGKVYELLNNGKEIFTDKTIIEIFNSVKELKKEILEIEKKESKSEK